jgi:iron complex outermembrane recepter protein
MHILKTAAKVRLYVSILAALCTTPFFGIAFAAPPAQARSVTYDLDIPAQSLKDSLQALAFASHHKLLYSSELVDGKRSPALKGQFATEQAVKALLSGTKLSYEVTSDGLVLIRASGPPDSTNTAAPCTDDGADHRAQLAQANPAARSTSSAATTVNPSAPNKEVPSDTGSEKSALTEIIVTATKRAERLQDVPMAASVITGAQLMATQATTLQDVVNATPGLQLISASPVTNELVVRGISVASSINASVATYVDETPFSPEGPFAFSTALAPNLDTYDLARIEVLRGPQGTLYGANALGGLLKYVTNAPDPSGFSASFLTGVNSVDHSGQTGWETHGMVNLPLGHDSALRIVADDTYALSWGVPSPESNEWGLPGPALLWARVQLRP